MKRKAILLVCALAWLGVTPAKLWSQGCGVVMTRHYSSYESASSDGTHIYTSVVVDGYGQCDTTPSCPCNTITHTPKAYNHIGSVGGWGTGNGGSANAYLSYTNNQSIAATPGVVYYFNGEGQIVCSIAGVFVDNLFPQQPEKIPSISGPNTVWWFNGKNPAPSAYPTSVTLTSTGGASTSWALTQADSKVTLSASTGAQITVSSTGTHFSGKVGDISIVATANGLSSKPFTMTARTPWKLSSVSRQTFCNSPPETYSTEITYNLIDNLSGTMSTDIFWNELVQAAVCENGSNWCNYAITTSPGSTNPLVDRLAPPLLNVSPERRPKPICNGQGSGTTRYRSIPQVMYAGSDTSGGVQVQSDTLGYYLDHGQHDSIQSPGQPPQ